MPIGVRFADGKFTDWLNGFATTALLLGANDRGTIGGVAFTKDFRFESVEFTLLFLSGGCFHALNIRDWLELLQTLTNQRK